MQDPQPSWLIDPRHLPTRRLQLQVHGVAQVHRPDGPPVPLHGRAAGLAALVALQPGVERERAARMLWPDAANPRQNLRQQLLRFRQALGAAPVEGDDHLLLAAGVSLSPPSRGANLLAGEPEGDDAFGLWLRQHRTAERQADQASRADALARAERDGDLDRALQLALEARALAPLDEAAATALMHVHHLRGDAAAGLATFRQLEQALGAEGQGPPAAATRALADALARSAPHAHRPVTTAMPVSLHRPPRRVGRAAE